MKRILMIILFAGTACGADLAPEFKEWKGSSPENTFRKEVDGRNVIGVLGKGDNSVAWHTPDLKLSPGGAYALRFKAKTAGVGTIISGLEGVNRDFAASADPLTGDFAFRVPDKDGPTILRLGHWELKGEAVFDNVELYPVQQVHRRWKELVLGEGEQIAGGIYQDTHMLGWRGSTIHRTLFKQKAGFNSDRWCFGPGAHVIYKHAIPTDLLDGTVRVNVSYYTGGKLAVSVSRDGDKWIRISEANKQEGIEAEIPAEMVPSKELYVRLEADGDKANMQVNAYSFRGRTGETVTRLGRTELIEERMIEPGLRVDVEGAEGGVLLRWHNDTDSKRELELEVNAGAKGRSSCGVRIPARGEAEALVVLDSCVPVQGKKIATTEPLALPAGRHPVSIMASDGKKRVCEWATAVTCTVLSESAYGYPCMGDVPGVTAWWCESAWKVGAQRPVPTGKPCVVQIEAARGEFEAAQLVLNGGEGGCMLQAVKAGELKGRKGSIPASAISIFEVATVRVDNPSDYLGEAGDYPDPLPPPALPLKIAANCNQALWVLARVPDHTPAGDYSGWITFKTNKGEGRVQIQLHVFDITMPKETHLRSGFGLSPPVIKRYHQLQTKEQELAVYEKYLQSFADHRIAPYSFYAHTPMKVKFMGKDAGRKVVIDWAEFDVAAKKHLDGGKFNAFQFPIEGLGGGTFYERSVGEFGGFKYGTPDYERLWSDYAMQIESHLKEKGWLKQAYVYWFDEPDKKDYEFVNERMDRIKKHAPGLTRLLTEQVEPELIGHVDLWCALTPQWTPKLAQERRKAGEEAWWYICCGPKAPYIGEFTEHPASEMRVWAWQSWQYGVQGILIWETTYWSSSTAFPDSLQDPWKDAMAYVSGYGTPKGAKQFWGNCDGRYLYPPRRDPNVKQGPCLDGPVSSLRWENLRDGVEDYEYLYMLNQQVERVKGRADGKLIAEARALLVVPESISKDSTHFTFDIRPVMEQRRKVATMIEKLQRLK